MPCKDRCGPYIVSRGGRGVFYSKDKPDNKYCTECDVRIAWSGVFCPCCDYRLRTKPRNGRMSGLKNEIVEPEAIILTTR